MYSCQLFGSEDFFLILSFFLFPIFCLTNQAMGKDQTALAQDSIQRREDARPARFNAFLSRDWTVRSLRLCRTPPTVAHCWRLLLPVQPSPFAMCPLPLTRLGSYPSPPPRRRPQGPRLRLLLCYPAAKGVAHGRASSPAPVGSSPPYSNPSPPLSVQALSCSAIWELAVGLMLRAWSRTAAPPGLAAASSRVRESDGLDRVHIKG